MERIEMSKRIPLTGIITVILYFLSVGAFVVSQTDIALTIWEMMTVISGPVVLLIMLYTSQRLATPDTYRTAMVAFMSCVCALTGLAHIVNIAVTRRLMREGVAVPLYFQIGQWPSVEMAVDYLAWGLFMGLAFICMGVPDTSKDKTKKRIRIVSIINGVLCLTGFAGAVFINENIWYLAPMGYGIGLIIICVLNIKAEDRS